MYCYNLVPQSKAKEGQIQWLIDMYGPVLKKRGSFPKYKTLTVIPESSPSDEHLSRGETIERSLP